MTHIDLGSTLVRARGADPTLLPDLLADLAASFEGTDPVVYLVDFGQTILQPLPDRSTHLEVADAEVIPGSMAGRAFIDQAVVTAERDDGVRVWAPLLEGSDRTGVIALTVPRAEDELLLACEQLGLLAGYLIAAHARATDVFDLYRRRRALSLPASIQWDLLPPLVLKTPIVSAAGLIEPAYEVGGDCFDYAANGPVFETAIMDAMGHGLGSTQLSGLAVGAYRHGRREARSLVDIHGQISEAIAAQYGSKSFVTGVLMRLDTMNGGITWTNAGHPLPLLIRGGRLIDELSCKPTPPWGLAGAEPEVGTMDLEPGDSVLLYTDGVIEARTPEGELFGLERLTDLLQRSTSDLSSPEETLRHLLRSVLDHQQAGLADDATVVLVRWDGPGVDPAQEA